jgi:23S rRNA pseudouridine1911/1915/1917 synthase
MNNNVESVDLEEELYEHFKFEVPKGKRLCDWQIFDGADSKCTTKQNSNCCYGREYFVNDATVKSNYKVSFWCSTRDADASSFENHIVPENIPLDIVYEDDTLLLINKSQEWLFILDMEYTGTLVHAGISFW